LQLDNLDKSPDTDLQKDLYNSSVCIATYNGEKFIAQQLKSILNQLKLNDEIIIVDDASSDKTLDEIRKINDSRIKLTTLNKNIGHVLAFEKALERTSNEIIYFSDQDDVWLSEKCIKVLDKFSTEIDSCLVVHSLSSINDEGMLISDNWLALPEANEKGFKFLLSELFQSKIFGSASAFKSNLLQIILPFPKFVYAHDHWLSICASLTGNTSFMSDNLVYRRIHDNNVTPRDGLNIFYKIKYRLIFIYLIIVAYLRIFLRGYKNEG
jgi:glycosyltransferase involved in cell wall biosynthesis